MGDRSRLAALVLVVLLTAGSSGAWAQSAPANASAIADATQAALIWLAIVDGGQLGQSWDAQAAELMPRLASLTPQQVRVLMMLSEGLLNKQIAAELGISEITVKAHRGRVMRKMRVDSLADLVRAAAALDVSLVAHA